MLATTTLDGLHDFVVEQVVPHFIPSGGRAVDLGAGSGALAVRLRALGWDVCAVDLNADAFKADVPFRCVDLNQPDFASKLGEGAFDLVTAVEVLEHVESPIGFLRNVGRLLKPDGLAVLTTPNVDNAPARLKFLLTGTIRMMDVRGEPTHISPIFWDLFVRQFLPRAQVRLQDHQHFPQGGYKATRPAFGWAMRALAAILPGTCLYGDIHILILQRTEAAPDAGNPD